MSSPCCHAGARHQLYANLSAFQSAPDAILQQHSFQACYISADGLVSAGPMQHSTPPIELLDATCDSDGVVPVHPRMGCMHDVVTPSAAQPPESTLCSPCLIHSNVSFEHGPATAPAARDGAAYQDLWQSSQLQACKAKLQAGAESQPELLQGSVAVLHTGAYQDALASHHNLFGQPETWYVVPLASAALVQDSSGYLDRAAADDHLLEDGDGVEAFDALATCGMELPDGWAKGRESVVRVMAGRYAFVGLADMLHASGIGLPEELEEFRHSTTYAMR
jgi:hypothetical protein